MQVLGIPRDADGNAIQRAYRKKMGEVKGKDEAAQQRIEAAHSQIMMAALTSRLKVGGAAEFQGAWEACHWQNQRAAAVTTQGAPASL